MPFKKKGMRMELPLFLGGFVKAKALHHRTVELRWVKPPLALDDVCFSAQSLALPHSAETLSGKPCPLLWSS